MVVGLNAVDNTATLAVLDDLPAYTDLYITDLGWDAGTNAFTSSLTGDGVTQWSVSAPIPKGTLLRFTFPSSVSVPALTNLSTSADLSGDLADLFGYTVTDPINLAGDQVFVFQDFGASPYFLSGSNNSSGTVDATNWNTGIVASLRDSMLPNGTGSQNALTNGVNAIGLPGGASQQDNVFYSGPSTQTDRAGWLARFMNVSNWSGDDTGTGSVATALGTQFTLGAPAPTITSASYDAWNTELTITGTGLSSAHTIAWSKFTLTGEGSGSHTLSTPNSTMYVYGNQGSVNVNFDDWEALSGILNKTGSSSTGGTTYNLAVAAGWNTTVGSAPASTTIALTVNRVNDPRVTYATYDSGTGVLSVSGFGIPSRAGAANDIDASKFTITGQSGATRTLSATPSVERYSSSSFALNLGLADRAAVNLLLDKNGTSSTGGTTYNLAAAEDWSAGANPAVVIADLTGNGVSVSGVIPPTTTSSTTTTSTTTTTTIEPTTTSTTTTTEPSTTTTTTTTIEPTTSTTSSTSSTTTSTTIAPTTSSSTSTSTPVPTTVVVTDPTTSSSTSTPTTQAPTSTSSSTSSTSMPAPSTPSSAPTSATPIVGSPLVDGSPTTAAELTTTTLASPTTAQSAVQPSTTVAVSSELGSGGAPDMPAPVFSAPAAADGVEAGEAVEVIGSEFEVASSARIEFQSTPIHLATVRVDETGSFRVTVQIPAGTVGDHHLVVIGRNRSGNEQVISLPITVSTPAEVTSELALTGAATTELGVRAVSVLAAGCCLVLAGRRRRKV